MKTQIVYALVSDENDYYYEQLLISAFTLKFHNPNCISFLIIDKETEKTITNKRNKIYKYIQKILVVETPKGFTKLERSRFLKTNIRKFISGNFLFIDTDTIICDHLSEIDNIKDDICMVTDYHGQDYSGDSLIWDTKNINKVQWPECNKSKRFNSGVIYVKDNLVTHNFYNNWYSMWLKSHEVGINIDQLALRKTNFDNGLIIKELSGEWNCQISCKNSEKYSNDAKIIHYYNNSDIVFTINDEKIFRAIKKEGDIPPNIIKLITGNKYEFLRKHKVVSGKELEFIQSNILQLYINHPTLFKHIECIYKICHKVHILLWNIKNKILK